MTVVVHIESLREHMHEKNDGPDTRQHLGHFLFCGFLY